MNNFMQINSSTWVNWTNSLKDKLSKLGYEAIDNIREIEFLVQNIFKKKTADPDGFMSGLF